MSSIVHSIQSTPVDSPNPSLPSLSEPPTNAKQSWVWLYFSNVKCQVNSQSGSPCKKILMHDQSGSTKSMSDHLWVLHQLINPKTTNLNKTLTLDKYVQHQNPKKSLSAETLKTALIYFICDCDLPMSVSKSTSFQALLELCSPSVLNILVRQKALTSHLLNVYFFHQEKLCALIYGSGKQLAFTTDTWTSPNIKAFMAITGHFINKEFNVVSVLLDLTEIEGNHLGQSLANQFPTTLKQYELEDSIIAITTDNAWVNQ
ncbi:hypothetical protein O181_110575 [Austropuccinia psidii MF-1]|uniref:Uncharacterized protein n=1 Tax=Austropuccinia psidii MF-1 TaxID=1389203 RepID=A0A9Q3PRP4_9BASI|nr:hypothetical protein [Austropuccinia psidii MF-1]